MNCVSSLSMPEGPECHTISKRLGRILKDKEILSIEIHGGRYKKHGNPYGFDEFIKNIKLQKRQMNFQI